MPKITKLTKAQEQRLPEYRDRYIEIGLSTKAADRRMAERAVSLAYKTAGLKPPQWVLWFDSPKAGLTASRLLSQARVQTWARVQDEVLAQVLAQIGDQVGDQARAQVRDQIWARVRAQVGDQIRTHVWAQVRAQVGAQVVDQVKDQVATQIWAQVWVQVWTKIWSQIRIQVGAQVRNEVIDQVWAQVGDQVRDKVVAQVWAQVRAQVRAEVRNEVVDQTWAQVRAYIGDQVRDEVWAQVRAQVRDEVGAQVVDQVSHILYGLHDADWLGMYQFFLEVCGIQACERLRPLATLAESAGWCWPFANACILTERPCTLFRDDSYRLHCDDGPALAYPDGFSIWALHGVRVPQELVETPSDQLDARWLMREPNAEIRRELVRKIGIERICRDLQATCVDRQGTYELLMLDLGDRRIRPYLKMRNPSIGVYHIEGVDPACCTVEQALKWRNGTSEPPVMLT